MVGAFYSHTTIVETRTWARLHRQERRARPAAVQTKLDQPAREESVAGTRQGQQQVDAASSVWVTRRRTLVCGEEPRPHRPAAREEELPAGETARLQVRMPFRHATPWWRWSAKASSPPRWCRLTGKDPRCTSDPEDGWDPAVYVSVLALRGRLRDVPWYSFFTWGFKAPREWWTAFWYEGRGIRSPHGAGGPVKPGLPPGRPKSGGHPGHQIDVKVSADKDSYPRARQGAGHHHGHACPTASRSQRRWRWPLWTRRCWNSCPTAAGTCWTPCCSAAAGRGDLDRAQMEIIGRRHYGRKAVPAGGGGGRSGRANCSTPCCCGPARGSTPTARPGDGAAERRAHHLPKSWPWPTATGLFGTGQHPIRATQDLQIISGLPPLVREDDQFRASSRCATPPKARHEGGSGTRATLLRT